MRFAFPLCALLLTFAIPCFAELPALQADFDANGYPDLVVRHNNSGPTANQVQITFMWNGLPIALDTVQPTLSVSWELSGVGDFNGDNMADLVWRNQNAAQSAIWFMNGPQVIGSVYLPLVSSDWRIIGTGDFNGDGKADLLWQRFGSTPQAAVWLIDNGNVTSSAVVAALPSNRVWRAGVIDDFNADGRSDVYWTDQSGVELDAIWLMNGTTIQQASYVDDPPPVRAHPEAAGDFDGDGDTDLMWRNSGSGIVFVRLMNGTQAASTNMLPYVDPFWNVMALADFDVDGRDDILWQNNGPGGNANRGNVVIWFMNGGNYDRLTEWPTPVTNEGAPFVQPYLPWPRNP